MTNWIGADAEVLTAEIAKNEKIDVIISDSLVAGGCASAVQQAGQVDPRARYLDGNSLACFWEEMKATNPDFSSSRVATGNDKTVRLAVMHAVAAVTGGTPPAENIFQAPMYEDWASGKPNPVTCRKDLPGAIYLSSELLYEDQAKAVGGQ